MKRPGLYLSCVASVLLFSCTQRADKSSAAKDSLSAVADTPSESACFVAHDAKDTANLVLHTFDKGKVKGHLLIKYVDKGKNDGQIEGAYKGDTLFVDYTFKIGTTNETTYKNPLAFLKKDGKLILGVGQIETSLGRSYFVKGKPISFDKGRFIFTPTACKDSI
jgi:hypothetical protein